MSTDWLQRYPFAALLLPCVEVAWMHSMVHRVFGPNNVYIGFYSRDAIFPILVGAAVALDVLNRQAPLTVAFGKTVAWINLFFLFSIAAALSHWDRLVQLFGPAVPTALLIGSAVTLATTAFFAQIPFRPLLDRLRPIGPRWFLLVGSVGLLMVYPGLLWKAWLWVGPPTGQAVFAILDLLGAGVTSIGTSHHLRIYHPKLTALIGPGCSGYEGIFFFLFAFSLFLVLEKDKISPIKCTLALVAGVAFLFFLNVVRIAGFFWMATRPGPVSGFANGKLFFAWAFHENLGWFLYFLGIWLFFTVLLRYRSRLLVPSPR